VRFEGWKALNVDSVLLPGDAFLGLDGGCVSGRDGGFLRSGGSGLLLALVRERLRARVADADRSLPAVLRNRRARERARRAEALRSRGLVPPAAPLLRSEPLLGRIEKVS